MILRRLPMRQQVPSQPTQGSGGANGGVEYGNLRTVYELPESSTASAATPSSIAHLSSWRRWLGQQGHTLRVRLSVLTSFVVIVSIAIITAASYATVHEILYQETDKQLQSQANSVIDSGTKDTSKPHNSGVYQPTFRDVTNSTKIMVIPPEQVGAGADVSIFKASLSDTEIAVIQGYDPYAFHTENDERFYSIKASDGRVVVVAQDMTITERALDSLALVLILVVISGSLGAVVIGVAVATAGLQPITRLRRAADRVSTTGKLRQLPVYSKDELGALTQSFNNMMKALEVSREKQKELVADASHELKTPLTSLRTNIELLLLASRSTNQSISEEDRREIERDVMGQLDEMSSLIGDLVDLAREDGPMYVTETVGLNSVIDGSIVRAQRRRPDVNFELHAVPWNMYGDPSSVNRAMVNLLDNAAKWSPENGTVRVWMETIEGKAPTRKNSRRYGKSHPDESPVTDDSLTDEHSQALEIRFADSGPGIPEEDRDKVFDRFYRSISSRSTPGSGLGLAIVKQVVERHGGAIVADESDDGGALIRVVLPGWVPRPGDDENSSNNPAVRAIQASIGDDENES